LVNSLPRPLYDGVLGVWYGKAPGVDRAADAIRHGNYVGTDPKGGVLALCGDDPACKSSTLPSASESLLAALQVPTFAPGSIQELIDFGRHAIACSRASGLWSAMKVATNVADAIATVQVGVDRVLPQLPKFDYDGTPYVHRPSAHLLAPQSLEMERTLVEVRLPLALEYGRLNGLNRVVHKAPRAALGIVASGAIAHEVRAALASLGIGEDGPVRVLQIGMLFPLDAEAVRAFADGLEEMLVIEEKGPFLERLVRDALYGGPSTPPVTGERDPIGDQLVPNHGTLESDRIARVIAARLLAHDHVDLDCNRLLGLDTATAPAATDIGASRTPFFCSGCPHNSSTLADDDAVVGAGIGCHAMVLLSPEGRGGLSGLTQMGGEGAQWIGTAPFVGVPHYVQNLGDGTFHHSGSLAIRAAVAAKLNVTYKLLYNRYVAMTGGQSVIGQMSPAAVAESLAAEGVTKIVITTDEPERYAGVKLPPIASVHHRRQLNRLQRELAQTSGVTVLMHDQACAAEIRRERKRGLAPARPAQIVINERVCEGCGDCGEKSSCLSVEPVDTEFGRKTRINQTSCNKDFSCLEGDCPSFLKVLAPQGGKPQVRRPEFALPDPPVCTQSDVRIRMIGIGGTGVVTVNQILGTAALLDGRHVNGLDQTGLSQKAGPVVSDLRLSSTANEGGAALPAGRADVLLAFDLIGAMSGSRLSAASAQRTVAVASRSVVPTADMVLKVHASGPHLDSAIAALEAVTRSGANVYLDAQLIAERLLGDVTPANMVVLGAALQTGVLPVSVAAIERAIELNGTMVELNLAAVAWGRAWVSAADAVEAAMAGRPTSAALSAEAQRLIDSVTREDGELRTLLEVRVPDLIGWGGRRAAAEYVKAVRRVRGLEEAQLKGSSAVTESVARGLYKLMAYKDEYEVARLHLEGLETLPPGSKVKILLHPPTLRAMGMERKLELGPWFLPVLRVLRAARRLRGSPLDPFGRAEVRRVERELPGEYLRELDAALRRLGPATADAVLELAELPDIVRGYEHIKLASVARFRERAAELHTQLAQD
jgi:indolepyruvate ferredoxin oxidoreductase